MPIVRHPRPARIDGPAAQLLIPRPTLRDERRDPARTSAANLASLNALEFRLRRAGSPDDGPAVFLAGTGARALIAHAAPRSTHQPPIANDALLRALAIPPDLVIQRGDFTHVEAFAKDLAPAWCDPTMRGRIVIADAITDDAMLMAVSDLARADTVQILHCARTLARRATVDHARIRVAFDAEARHQRIGVTEVAVLSPAGIEMAALARFGISALQADRMPNAHTYVTSRAVADLLAGGWASDGRRTQKRRHRHPQPTMPAIFESQGMRKFLEQFFEHAHVPAVAGAAARLLGRPTQDVYFSLGFLRQQMLGRRFTVVTSR